MPPGSPDLSLTKMLFLHPILDLVSVSNIRDRGRKLNVHVYIDANHVIIT